MVVDDRKRFKEKLRATGKLKRVGLKMLQEEVDRLHDVESERLRVELGVSLDELNMCRSRRWRD